MADISIRLSRTGNDDSTLTMFLPLTRLAVKGLSFFVTKISVKPKKILALLSLIFSFLPWHLSTAQENQNRQELRENIHLHINKTVFFRGESLWLTAYVQDQYLKLPSEQTSTLHVAFYDLKNTILKHKTFYVEKGIAIGDFEIDSTFIDREYRVVAWTNYIQNFEKLKPFNQIIQIMQDKEESETGEENPFQITIYPEGGKIIQGVYNQIAFRLEDAIGRGIQQNEMVLVSNDGDIVQARLGTDSYGYGRISLIVEQGKKYFLKYRDTNEYSVDKELPDPVTNELGIQVDNNLEDKILVKLMATDSLFEIKKGQPYTLAIFQDKDLLLDNIIIEEDSLIFSLDRSTMPYGLNTAVLLNEDLVPVAHRMFFNHRKDTNRHISSLLLHHTIEQDSIELYFSLPKEFAQEAFISISALPGGSQAYYPENSIASSFLLAPYLAKRNALRYYFDEQNRKKRFEMDTRLLLEGNGMYDWSSINHEEIKIKFAMENGFKIKGKVGDADLREEKQVYLITDQTKTVGFQDLKSDKSFEINMNLFQGDSLGIALIGNKGKLRKALPDIEQQFSFKDLSIEMLGNVEKWSSKKTKSTNIDFKDIFESDVTANTIVLDEAIVTDSYKTNKSSLLTANIELKYIDDTDINRSPSLAAYLRRSGLRVLFNQQNEMIVLSPRYPYPAMSISVNGMSANPGELIGLPLSRVQSIVVGIKAYGYSSGENNFLSIQLRPSVRISSDKRNQYVKFLIENGYTRTQTYSDPGYNYESTMFSHFGVLDWKSALKISSLETTSVKIPTYGQEKVLLYVEGMSSDGSLITFSEEINIEP